jgi:membrane protein required for beta-lactamase induction
VKGYGGYLVGLLWFVVASCFIIVAANLIGHATHEASEQTHKHRMECIDRGGEIKYITNVGTTCDKD